MLYIARCILELKTPLHCGGKDDSLMDAPVIRDAYGLWRIPGSSVAGVLRSWLRKACGETAASSLFGCEQDNSGKASLVWCSDAILLDYDNQPAWHKYLEGTPPSITAPVFLRDHVRIDDDSGAASNTGKFDEEYVPSGTRFAMEISLDGWIKAPGDEALNYFARLLQALHEGAVNFGGHGANGYGEYSVIRQECRHFVLSNSKHMEQWLNLPSLAAQAQPLFPPDAGEPWQPDSAPSKNAHSKGISGTFSLPLSASGPLLIAGGRPEGSVDADMSFAPTVVYNYERKSNPQCRVYTIPGSSLRGVIRHRVLHVLKALGFADPEHEMERIFGTAKGETGQKGRVCIADAPLQRNNDTVDAAACQTVQHVAVDRFTGGAMDAHLFNEAPVWRDKVKLTLRMRLYELEPAQAGILLHALIDLVQGDVAIGSGGNRGNGRLQLDTSTRPVFNLVWDGEHLDETESTAHAWLSRLQNAVREAIAKENHHVA